MTCLWFSPGIFADSCKWNIAFCSKYTIQITHVDNICFIILESTERFLGSTNEIETSVKRKSANGGISVSLRQTNVRLTNTNRKRVIKMLFVVVFEYFVCCSPLYILNTWKVIHYMSIHNKVSDAAWSLILLLNYSSSCIHPITYCFMNKNFRNAFLGVFHCFLSKTKPFGRSCTQMTNMNSSSLARRGNNKIERDISKDASEFWLIFVYMCGLIFACRSKNTNVTVIVASDIANYDWYYEHRNQ